jgi:hypothetical protein
MAAGSYILMTIRTLLSPSVFTLLEFELIFSLLIWRDPMLECMLRLMRVQW